MTADQAFIEMICDAEGDMNIFEGKLEVTAAPYAEFLQTAKQETKESESRIKAKAEAEVYGEDEEFSRNPEERRRALRKGEMVNKFYKKVNWKLYYEKLNSQEYNSEFYDDGKIAYMIIGDQKLTLEMQENGEFSVIKIERNNKYARVSTDMGRAEKNIERKGVSGMRDRDGIRNNRLSQRLEQNKGRGFSDNERGDNGTRSDQEAAADNRKGEVEENFSMNADVESVGNLVALHNLNSEKLWKSLKLGGFPMPSIAATKTVYSSAGTIFTLYKKQVSPIPETLVFFITILSGQAASTLFFFFLLRTKTDITAARNSTTWVNRLPYAPARMSYMIHSVELSTKSIR